MSSENHEFLQAIREVAADHIENSDASAITNYINDLTNWELLQLLAAADTAADKKATRYE